MSLLPRWWRRNFLEAEFGLALLLTLALVAWVQYFNGRMLLFTLLSGGRVEIYAALAAIFGALLGFTITTESIVLGYSGSERMLLVRQSAYYPQVWRVFNSTIRVLGLGTLIALLGLALDSDLHPHEAWLVLTIFITLLATFRIMRCIWVLESIIRIVTRGEQAGSQR